MRRAVIAHAEVVYPRACPLAGRRVDGEILVLDALFSPLLAAHLLAVSLAMVGPLACVWLEWSAARRPDRFSEQLSVEFADWSCWALVSGIALGGLLLARRAWLSDSAYFSALATVPRDRAWFALAELVFSLACLTTYARLRRSPARRWIQRIVAIAGASNLLVHFPAFFAILSVVTQRDELLGQPMNRADYQSLLLDPEVLSRVTHIWLAAVVMTGIVLMGLASRAFDQDSRPASAERVVKAAALAALLSALLQVPVGWWVAMQMSHSARESLLGGDWIATSLFAVSVALALALMHRLASITLAESEPRQIRSSMAIMALLVVLMVGVRARSQHRVTTSKAPDAHEIGLFEPSRLVCGESCVPIETLIDLISPIR